MKINYQKFQRDVGTLASQLKISSYSSIYAVPRGGVCVALELTKYLTVLNLPLVEKPEEKSLIVDDLIDSGRTLEKYHTTHDIAVLYRKPHSPMYPEFVVETIDDWIEFFYEETDKDIMFHLERVNQFIKGVFKHEDEKR